jgi:hypothetical protein
MGFIPDNVVHTFVVPPGKKIKLSLNVLVPGFEQYIRVIGDGFFKRDGKGVEIQTLDTFITILLNANLRPTQALSLMYMLLQG